MKRAILPLAASLLFLLGAPARARGLLPVVRAVRRLRPALVGRRRSRSSCALNQERRSSSGPSAPTGRVRASWAAIRAFNTTRSASIGSCFPSAVIANRDSKGVLLVVGESGTLHELGNAAGYGADVSVDWSPDG